MTQENQQRQESDEGIDTVQERIDELDSSLLDEIHEDARLQSGVPDSENTSDLDFIQMTGLTRPSSPLTEGSAAPAIDPAEMDPTQPINFYEKGVGDVDASTEPVTLHGGGIRDDDLVMFPEDSKSVAGLKQIIADLTGDDVADSEPPPMEPVQAETEEAGASEEIEEPSTAPETEEAPSAHESTEEVVVAKEEEIGINIDSIVPITLLDNDEDDEQNETPELAVDKAEVEEIREEAPPTVSEEEEEDDGEHAPAATANLPVADPEEEAAVKPTPPATASAPDLAEAEAFIRELQEQPHNDEAPVVPLTGPRTHAGSDDDESVYDYAIEYAIEEEPDRPGRRSGRSRRTRHRRKLVRWSIRLAALLVIAVAAYYSWDWTDRALVTPVRLYNEAVAAAAAGNHLAAARKFESFAQRNPYDALQPEALFQAAYEHLQANNVDQASLTGAFELLQIFVSDNPDHPKAPRARSLMGIVSFRLERYEEAIRILRDPALQAEDPDTALASYRIVARSYGALNEVQAARDYYLQAAYFEGNYSQDQDYAELGDLYQALAAKTDNSALKNQYRLEAIEFWNRAILTPTIDPGTRNSLKRRKEIMLGEMDKVLFTEPVNLPEPTPLAPAPVNTLGAPPEAIEDFDEDSFLIIEEKKDASLPLPSSP